MLKAYNIASINFDCRFSVIKNILLEVVNKVSFNYVNKAAL